MIKTLSPYYFYTNWISPLTGATATAYTINLYVWAGDKTAIPTEPQYSLTKQNIGQSVGTDRLNASRLINDFLEFTPLITEGFNPTGCQKWVHKEIIYTTDDVADDGVKQLPETILATKGYTYGSEGENAQPPANGVLMEGIEFKANRNTIFSVPIYLENKGIITVISYPDLQINDSYDTDLGDTNDSYQAISLLNVDSSAATTDTYFLITYNGVQIYVEITDEHKYTPVDIYFVNKEGEQQSLTFMKERKDMMSITKETYENDRGQPKDGYHQFVDYNVQAETKFTLSSGFVDEGVNETFKQLLLSSRIYLYNGTDFIPLNVTKKEIEYKNRVNDRLVNYVISFKYSYNEVNNI